MVSDPYRPLTPEQAQTLESFLARRIAREPVRPHPRPQGLLDRRAQGHPRRAHPRVRIPRPWSTAC
ncbi:MAG: hypothetical protein WDN45_03365 [Caulobacteraceae bacterium]